MNVLAIQITKLSKQYIIQATLTVVLLGLVVQEVDNAIHWINLYPVDRAIVFPNTYPLDSGFLGG